VSEPTGDLKKCAFSETDAVLWQGEPPKIELSWNNTYGFLLVATVGVNGSDLPTKFSWWWWSRSRLPHR
jgi:hypothetical protein